MMMSRSYRIALATAIFLHCMIVAYFSYESTNKRPVLTAESRNEAGQMQPQPAEQPAAQAKAEPEPIKAVSVNSQEIMNAVNQLKNERAQQQQAEASRQRALKQQAELARKQRIEEQKHLQKLKDEAAALAVAREKRLAEEKEHLKQLALQKKEQEKQIEDMKKQQLLLKKQQEEAAKQLAKKNQETAEKLKQQALAKEAQEKAEKARADWVKKQQAAAQLAAADAANKARVAGEVDKYKALILNAISQQWILPQNVDSNMSSQFRIRLAPNGAVLEVALIRSSGDAILDRSAQAAIYKASPLPVPTDVSTFNLFRDISLTVRPVNGRG